MNYRNNILLLKVFILILFIGGCDEIITDSNWDSNKPIIEGSERIVTQYPDNNNFSSINLSHSIKADIFKSSDYSIKIKADDNVVEKLKISQLGDELYIALDENYNYEDITLIAEIGLPDISKLDFSGAISAKLYGFNFTHSFEIYLSGASHVEGSIFTGDLLIDMSGASDIEFSGEGEKLTLYGSGASSVEMSEFPVKEADIYLSGASYTNVKAMEYLKARLTGASVLYYTGNPTIGELSIDGVSKVIRY